MPVEVISASQTGTGTSQTQPEQPAVPWGLQPGPTRAECGSRAGEQRVPRSWDVVWDGINQCVEGRLSQQWCKVPWRRPGLLEGRSRSSQEQQVLLQMCPASGGTGGTSGWRILWEKEEWLAQMPREPAFATSQLREVPLQQVTSWPASSPTRASLRC